MNSKELIAYICTKIKAFWLAISIDGSGFDSSQFACLMKSVDNRFWKMVEPFIRRIVQANYDSFNLCPTVTVDEIMKNLMKALLKTKNVVFVRLPTVNAPRWPDHIRKQFFADI